MQTSVESRRCSTHTSVRYHIAAVLAALALAVLAGCAKREEQRRTQDEPAKYSAMVTNVAATSLLRAGMMRGTVRNNHGAQDAGQVQNDTARHVDDYQGLLDGTNFNLQALISTNQPVALTEEGVRRLRMSAHAAARGQDYTQCVALAAVLLRCTNLPSYVGSSVHLLMAQGLQNVCGLTAAVPYYEYVLGFWQGLSAPNAGDEGNALIAANMLSQAAFMRGDMEAGMAYSACMYKIADTCKLPSRMRDKHKMQHIWNTYRNQGRAAALALLNKTVFDDEASRECAQGMLAEP